MPSIQELQSHHDKLLNYSTTLQPSGSTICISPHLTYFHLSFCNAANKLLELDFMNYTNPISFQITWASMSITCKEKKKKQKTSKSCSAEVISYFKKDGTSHLHLRLFKLFFLLKTNSWFRKGAQGFIFFWLLGRLVLFEYFTSSSSREKNPPHEATRGGALSDQAAAL